MENRRVIKNLVLVMFSVLLLTSVSAYVQFFQEDYDYTNRTLLHSVVVYNDDNNDFIIGGEPLEFYFLYNIYLGDWNELNPDFTIEFCNYTIQQFPKVSGTPSVVVNETFRENSDDREYFLRMEDGDVAFFDVECSFNGTNGSGLIIPANVQIVVPTEECEECQFYKWSLLDRDIQKAELVGGNIVDIVDNIKSIISLNFEIWLVIFWFILIIVAIHSTGLLFIGIVWLFGYLKGLVK